MKELRRILSKKFRLSPEEVASARDLINEAVSQHIEHTLKIRNICRDADDDHVIACALAAKAGYLVTGDAGLLEGRSCQGVRIVSPRDFETLFV